MMLIRAKYDGKDKKLKNLIRYGISQEAFDIIEYLGMNRFLRLAEKGKLYSMLSSQFLELIENGTDRVIEALFNEYGKDVEGEYMFHYQLRFKAILRYDFFCTLVQENPGWYDKAPKFFKMVMDKALSEPDLHHGHLVIEAYSKYITDGIRFCRYAGYLD